jgi:hypothetical protein
MVEEIKSIESLDSFEFPGEQKGYSDHYEGWKIVTDSQTILFGITNQQGCCESWGHVCSEDNPQDFVGAEITDIFITDDGLETTKVKVSEVYDGGVVFVTLNTNKGKLQFAVYNEHNGYYGHDVRLESTQTKYNGYV